MTRFLVALALVALAASLYVAAAPGSRQGAPSLQRQVRTLQKQMKALQKQVKAVKVEADFLSGFISTCVAHKPVGVHQGGTTGGGYLFGQSTSSYVLTTALDLAEQSPQFQFFALNTSVPNCVTIVSQLAAHGLGHLPRLALRR